jgi:hypothetical protein
MNEVETTFLFVGNILVVWGAGWIAHRLPGKGGDKEFLSTFLPFIAASIMWGVTGGLGVPWIGGAIFIFWLGYVFGSAERG